MNVVERVEAVIIAALTVIGALGVLCNVLANVLPEGRWKTAASYAGVRLLKAKAAARGMLDAPKSEPRS